MPMLQSPGYSIVKDFSIALFRFEVCDVLIIGTTDARVACFFVFTRQFSNHRARNFKLLFITRERFGLAL